MYNQSGNRGCKIGNWVEEANCGNDVDGNGYEVTRNRVTPPDSRNSKPMQSTVGAEYADPHNHSKFKAPESGGSRSRRMRDQFLEEAKREYKEREEAYQQKSQFRSDYQSDAKSNFKPPTDDFRRANVVPGRKVMKQQTGEEIPIPQKEVYEFDDRHLSGDTPVTYYSQRLVEGVVPATAATGNNPFNRNSGFSNPVEDSRVFHLEADDGNMSYDEKMRLRTAQKNYVGGSIAEEYLLDELCKLLETQDPDHVQGLLYDMPSTVSKSDIKRFLGQLGTSKFDYRDTEALSLYFDGMRRDDVVHTLLGSKRAIESNSSESSHRSRVSDDVHLYAVSIAVKSSTSVQTVECEIPKSKLKQKLVYPEDESVMKAVLRKQGIMPLRIVGFECIH